MNIFQKQIKQNSIPNYIKRKQKGQFVWEKRTLCTILLKQCWVRSLVCFPLNMFDPQLSFTF